MKKQGAKTATPRLRFPEFRAAAAWKEQSLVRASERITQGGTPDTSVPSYWDGDIAWITPAEMGKGDDPHVASTVRRITEEGLQACSSELLPVRSVIISTRAPIGHLAINTVPMAINQGCKGIVPGPDLDHKFLLASLLLAKRRLTDLGSGNTFKELSTSALKSFAIVLPSRAEQQKIADCLTSLDEVIAAQGRKVDALKAHKRGLMQQLFPRDGETRPRLRFPEFRDAPEWRNVVLGDVSTIVRGGSPRPIDDFLTVEPDGLNWLKIGDVDREAKYITATEEKVRVEALSKTRVIRPGDFILSNSMSFGRPYISAIDACIHDGWIAVTRIHKTVVHEFLYYSILSERSQTYFANQAAGSGVQNLNKDIIKLLPVAVPGKREQQRIADCLSSLDNQITAESNQLTALKTHKQGLMQQLFPATEGATP